MSKKRISKLLLPAIILFSAVCPSAGAANAAPEVSAAAAVLVEQGSGQVLYGRQADVPLPIASITKIMTGLLAVERCAPEEEVTIRAEWLQVEGSKMGLRAGERCRVEELLYGLLLASGNDAAVALACHMAGDVPTFVDWMNRRAAELGMADTHFMNPHGLTREGHYSTARDMGRLACAAMGNPRFAAAAGTRTAEVGDRSLRNHNKLLWSYPGALGVKTGYTDAAGRTLVSCAEREGLTLVCVTLNDPADWRDHTALLDWGFSAYAAVDPAEQGWTLPVVSGAAVSVSAAISETAAVPVPREAAREWRITLPPFLYAPVHRGETLGRAELFVDDEPVFSGAIKALEAVELNGAERLSFWEGLRRTWYNACGAEYTP